MDLRQAVNVAKNHIAEAFTGEAIFNVGLEEVEFDEHENVWNITIGFERNWSGQPIPPSWLLPSEPAARQVRRDYKVVTIRDEDGAVASIKIRDVAA